MVVTPQFILVLLVVSVLRTSYVIGTSVGGNDFCASRISGPEVWSDKRGIKGILFTYLGGYYSTVHLVLIPTMLFLNALFSALVTFAATFAMAAPTMHQNGTITYHNGTKTLNARKNDPFSGQYGDHLIRVNAFPAQGCMEGPTTFDFAGSEGTECWNYDHVESLQVTAAYVCLFCPLYSSFPTAPPSSSLAFEMVLVAANRSDWQGLLGMVLFGPILRRNRGSDQKYLL
ncbi:MAG: hypothetical protein Q9212_005695 [Teloschistes hypoglaucus]